MSKSSPCEKVVPYLALSVISLSPSLNASVSPVDELDELFVEIPIVSSASFFEMDRKEAMNNSIVMTSPQLEGSNVRNLSDLIQYHLAGANIAGGSGHGRSLGFRGISGPGDSMGTKHLILYNGQNVNLRVVDRTSPAFYVLPFMGEFANVETLKGPGGILHGSGAVVGLTNLTTKNGTNFPGFESSIEYGAEEESYVMQTQYGLSYSDYDNDKQKDLYLYFGIAASGDGTTWDGADLLKKYNPNVYQFYAPDSVENIDHLKQDYYYSPNYRLSVNWNHLDFNLNAFYQTFKKPREHAGAWFHEFEYSNSHLVTLGVRSKYTWNLSETDKIEWSGSALWQDYGQGATYLESQDFGKSYIEIMSESSFQSKLVYLSTRFANHQLAFGGSMERRSSSPDATFSTSDYDEVLVHVSGIDTHFYEASVFGEDRFRINDELTAFFGFRYDKALFSKLDNSKVDYWERFDEFLEGERIFDAPPSQDKFTIRLGGSYSFNKDTLLKFSYQQGFRYSNIFRYSELHTMNTVLEDSDFSYRIPDLKPETMDSYELTFIKSINSANLDLESTLYYFEHKDFLFFGVVDGMPQEVIDYFKENVNHPGSSHTNLEKFSGYGVESLLTWLPTLNTKVKFGYDYARPTDADTSDTGLGATYEDGSRWGYFPTHMIKARVNSLFFENRLNLGVYATYESAFDTDEMVGSPSDVYKHSRTVVDVSAKFKINKTSHVKLLVKNLFESEVPPMRTANSGSNPFIFNPGAFSRFIYLQADVLF